MHGLRLSDETDGNRAKRRRERPPNVWLPSMQKGPAAYHRKRPDRGLVRAEANVMYQREDCLVEASICRNRSRADPARSDYWIDRAIVWHLRAVRAPHGKAITHEIFDGRLISKAAK